MDLIPGLEDSLEKEMATHSNILAWKIPWKQETGGYSPKGHKELDMTEWLSTAQYRECLEENKQITSLFHCNT